MQGLECCKSRSTCNDECPYYHIMEDPNFGMDDCTSQLAADSLALLKAQEPRVMTLEELDAIYQKETAHFWPFDTPPYMFMTVNPNVRLVSGFWICWRDIMYSLENNSQFYVRENYGKEWIIWTKKPTVAQRDAVKWP